MSPFATGLPTDPAASHDLLLLLLDVSLTGLALLRPVYAQGDNPAIIDLAYVQLNATGQRLLGLPAQPLHTFLTLYPQAVDTGLFAFFCAAFRAEPGSRPVASYQYDGSASYCILAAQRSGELLLVSFTDTAAQERSTVELALRQAQAREQAARELAEAHVAERTRQLEAARATAEQQRQRLERLVLEAPAAISINGGPDMVFELFNAPFAAMFGGRPRLGLPLLEAMPELVGQPAWRTMRQVYDTGITHHAQGIRVPLARPTDGVLEDRYFNYIQQARFAESGQVDGVLVFAFEVTEQVLARQAQEAIAQRMRLLADALPVLIAYVDTDECYQFNNAAYWQWFGRTPASLRGQAIRAVIGEVPYHTEQGYIKRALAGERVEFEAYMPYRPDFARYVRSSFVPDVQAGKVLGFYKLTNDITAQVLARQRVEELNDELSLANSALRDSNQHLTRSNADLATFVYTASHDLKAPIANVQGLLTALREELPADVLHAAEIAQLFELLDGTVQRFQGTIGQLTDLAKLQQTHAGPAKPVLLTALVSDVRLDLTSLAQRIGVRFTLDVPLGLVVHFAPANLRSIVYNLLSNAIKYHDPSRPARVWLRAAHTTQGIQLVVQDNGLGLTESQQKRLFGLFQRLHTHVEGSGVGLYLVKRLVENAGGTISVQSEVGVGSTFTVVLPG